MKHRFPFFCMMICLFLSGSQSFSDENLRESSELKSKTVMATRTNFRSKWQSQFEKLLGELSASFSNEENITNEQLYGLARAYIRSELEKSLDKIQRSQLEATSDIVILKSMYDLFNYANPLGRDLKSVPTYDPSRSSNLVLSERWNKLYSKALADAVEMYDYGEQVYGDQLYEMGRCLFLSQLHNDKAPLHSLSGAEWKVLNRALYVLCYLNVPGGFNPSNAPTLRPKLAKLRNKAKKWRRVEKFLTDNSGIIAIGDGLIDFLLGSPKDWEAFSAKLAEEKSWKNAALTLATKTNLLITEAAGYYTDLSNEEDEFDQNSIYSNYMTGDTYAVFIPPAVRIHIIKNIGSDLSSLTIAKNMKAFIKYGRTYGMGGWKEIAQLYSENSDKEKNDLTIREFKDYLISENVLLNDIDLGNNADTTLNEYLNSSTCENDLGVFFSESSIYSTF